MTLLRTLGYACAGAGMFLSLWMLTLVGAFFLLLGRSWVSALLVGFILDLLYGSLPFLPFLYPFTVGVAVTALVWELVRVRLRGNRSS